MEGRTQGDFQYQSRDRDQPEREEVWNEPLKATVNDPSLADLLQLLFSKTAAYLLLNT